MERLKYLSSANVEALRQNVLSNATRYQYGNFNDLMKEGEWSIELDLEFDPSPLTKLDPASNPEAEIRNSLLVWQALHGLTPSLAYEEGIWLRLTHIECLEFSRKRWLRDIKLEEFEQKVLSHFFARTLNDRRDDNAVSRLWWNAYIANQVMPGKMATALEVILKRADMRSNLVERSRTGSRAAVTASVIRVAQAVPWISATEANFRSFMKILNRRGGGILFETMTEPEIDLFMKECATRAERAPVP